MQDRQPLFNGELRKHLGAYSFLVGDLSSFSKSKSLPVSSPASTPRPRVRLSMTGDRSNTLPRSIARMARIGSRAFLGNCQSLMPRLLRKDFTALPGVL